MSASRFYGIWKNIKGRCKNRKNKNYGKRGIKNLWKSFEDFRNDMYKSYEAHVKKFSEKQTTIDRIDNNGHYSKENCRWATYREQLKNKGNNHFITFNGKTLCLTEWAKKLDMNSLTLSGRINYSKWSIKKALTTPVLTRKR